MLFQFNVMVEFVQLNKADRFIVCINNKDMRLVVVQSFLYELFACFIIICLAVKYPVEIE